MSCCNNKKHYFCRRNRIVLMSNHGRATTITKELMEEIGKYKILETAFFFNQPLVVNSKKRKRNDSFIDMIKNYTCSFFEEEEEEIGLPEGIEEIQFGIDFNYPIDNLPSTIIKISFGDKFNQPINNLPCGVKKMRFERNSKFNQPVDLLPGKLEYLDLPNSFNHPLNNLPNGLKYLRVGKNFDQDLNNLPDSLEKIVLPKCYLREIRNFPKSLKQIMISKEYPFHVPDSIQRKERISVKYYKLFNLCSPMFHIGWRWPSPCQNKNNNNCQ